MCEIAPKLILSDIEGTTTSISFVKDALFPYAKKHAQSYLEQTFNDTETQQLIKELVALPEYAQFESTANKTECTANSLQHIVEFVHYLIDADLKLTPLKNLQGLIWQRGYTKGELKGHVYEDVPIAFEHWQKNGIAIAIYSSGSVKAQQLLFSATEYGDLQTKFICGNFDTNIGPKQHANSYGKILENIQLQPHQVVFLTDIVKEAEAARAAGIQAILLKRPGNEPLPENIKQEYTVISSFAELNFGSKC